MAFYTYKCKCKNDEPFEVEARPSEIPLKNCPHCGQENPERVWCPNIRQNWETGGRCGTSTSWDNKKK